MKSIMIIGNWKWQIYEEALAHGFSSLGVHVFRYSYDKYDCSDKAFSLRNPLKHRSNIVNINSEIVQECINNQPDMILFYRGGFIRPATIKHLNKALPKTVISLYHNDNPFVGIKNRLKYYYFLQSIQYSDITYVYRPSNIKDCLKFKAANPKLLLSHSYSLYNWWNEEYDGNKKKYDVVFIGHYEKDDRIKYINTIFDAGIDLHIFGPGWKNIFKKYNWPETKCHDRVSGDTYRASINSAKIALVFLSRKNKDVYTRRCFEIPACGTAMLLPNILFLKKLFPKNIAAVYYNNQQTIVATIQNIINEPIKLKTIIKNAYKIVQDHNEIARAKQIIQDYKQFQH